MAIADNNERFTFVLDKGLKNKLQILADVDKRKLGNYVAHILEQHVIEYERMLLDKYGFDGYDEAYDAFFGGLRSHLFVNEADFEMQAKLERLRQIQKDFGDKV
ncbi:hypothetical protein [Paenibacillus cremeus]|uniref:Uncharacterized protein n=1 Tax=Paenibacillus cremeus TaxID=2163881 RepID=A0A559KCX6_9BACL|nr:hypothetical protein [Paenibacillus cremeus]TVY09980.1 hypothetical protein FPZ49_11455 [Paenibacillus cremeus]